MERKKKSIVAVGENSDAKQTICRQLQKNHHIIVPCCAKPEEYQEAIEYAVHEYGGIDGVFYLADTQEEDSFLELSFEDWRHVMDENLDGAILCCQSMAEQMRAQGRKESPYSILLITGGAKAFADSEKGALTASTWALRGLMRHLAIRQIRRLHREARYKLQTVHAGKIMNIWHPVHSFSLRMTRLM